MDEPVSASIGCSSGTHFRDARAHVRSAIRHAESEGISSETFAFALMSEALPCIVHQHGPLWTAEMLTKLAQRIATGLV